MDDGSISNYIYIQAYIYIYNQLLKHLKYVNMSRKIYDSLYGEDVDRFLTTFGVIYWPIYWFYLIVLLRLSWYNIIYIYFDEPPSTRNVQINYNIEAYNIICRRLRDNYARFYQLCVTNYNTANKIFSHNLYMYTG